MFETGQLPFVANDCRFLCSSRGSSSCLTQVVRFDYAGLPRPRLRRHVEEVSSRLNLLNCVVVASYLSPSGPLARWFCCSPLVCLPDASSVIRFRLVPNPSTPVGLTARTPSARSRGSSSASGAVAPAPDALRPDPTGFHVQHQRRLAPARVRVGAGHRAGEPRDVAALPAQQRARRPQRVEVAAVAVDDQQPPAQRQADRPYSTSSPVSASVPSETVPGKPSCSPLAP